jgi:hypothetical protein
MTGLIALISPAALKAFAKQVSISESPRVKTYRSSMFGDVAVKSRSA